MKEVDAGYTPEIDLNAQLTPEELDEVMSDVRTGWNDGTCVDGRADAEPRSWEDRERDAFGVPKPPAGLRLPKGWDK